MNELGPEGRRNLHFSCLPQENAAEEQPVGKRGRDSLLILEVGLIMEYIQEEGEYMAELVALWKASP